MYVLNIDKTNTAADSNSKINEKSLPQFNVWGKKGLVVLSHSYKTHTVTHWF